jgi:putative endonuclease
VRCNDDSLYTGITSNVQRRFLEHQQQNGKCAKYLRGKAPLTLLFSQAIGTRSEALKMEHVIKALSKDKKEILIKTGILPE